MRVAIALPTFLTRTQSYTYIRARALAERGCTVRFFFREFGDRELLTDHIISQMLTAGVSWQTLPQSKAILLEFAEVSWQMASPSRLPIAFSVIKQARDMDYTVRQGIGRLWQIYPVAAWQPDIIHIDVSYFAHQVLKSLSLLERPIVISLRGADVDEKPRLSNKWRNWYKEVSQMPHVYFHCVSEHIRRRAIEWGALPERTHVIYQGIDIAQTPQEKNNKADLKSRRDLVIVSRLAYEKGVDLAIHAVNVLQEKGYKIKLHIVGDGYLRKELELLVEGLELTSSVVFYGWKSNHWVRQFLNRCRYTHIFIQPSRLESFGQAILEAMVAGLPVVAAYTGGIPELVQDEKTGLLHETENVNDLVCKLIRLLSAERAARKLGENSQRCAVKKFALSREAEVFSDWFEQMLQINSNTS